MSIFHRQRFSPLGFGLRHFQNTRLLLKPSDGPLGGSQSGTHLLRELAMTKRSYVSFQALALLSLAIGIVNDVLAESIPKRSATASVPATIVCFCESLGVEVV